MSTALAHAPYAEVTLGGSRVALLKDGDQAFPAMLSAIAEATSTICLETYILASDATGQRFARALIERAQAGVEVNLIYDDWGSAVTPEYLTELQLGGVRVVAFHPVRFRGRLRDFFARAFRRNHRKALIVDGRVAFTGGLNISNDYASLQDGGQGWRDTHVRIVGPEAVELERLFLDTWRRHRGPRLDEPRYRRERPKPGGKIRILGNHFRKDRKDIRKAYVQAIGAARERIQLTQAYFLPPSRVIKELQRAARRGVGVSVILAASTDVPAVLYAARGLYGALLKAGVQVFEWEGRILHAKTAVVDGHWSTVGSTNLDGMSLRLNLEVNAVFEDATFACAVEKLFHDDLKQCRRIDLQFLRDRGVFERLLSWLAGKVRRWL